jgi:S1-C subfamily serine protease
MVVHLSGSRRGTTERLSGDTLRIGTAADAEIHFPADREPPISPLHATLRRQGATYDLQAEPDQPVWVNGQPVTQVTLGSGDVVRIGQGGPLLRFRLYKGGSNAYKSVGDTLSDCVDCARHGGKTPLDRAAIFLAGMPRELVTQTTPWFRSVVVLLLVSLSVGIAMLAWRSVQLEERLASERTRSVETSERLATLEAQAGAAQRVILAATGSIIFIQGAYGFVEPESRKPLRYLGLGPDGQPLRNVSGEPLITLEGDGPIVERLYTGTAFVASEDGLLLTNRHVAIPWRDDESAQALIAQLSETTPQPGDEVIVMGYPTGIRASEGQPDFWNVVSRLSETGRISPLATRGIVGQVTAAAVVYDAETTSGGSGGPVISLNGEVVAINTAILPEFGGSNLGVPVKRARELLAIARK